jgi:hypothetical protein
MSRLTFDLHKSARQDTVEDFVLTPLQFSTDTSVSEPVDTPIEGVGSNSGLGEEQSSTLYQTLSSSSSGRMPLDI